MCELGFRGDIEAAEQCRHRIEATGARCAVVRADLSEPAGVDHLFGEAAKVGPLTGVVSNAGATFHVGPLAETSVDVVRQSVELNLTAALLVARAAVRTMGTSTAAAAGCWST